MGWVMIFDVAVFSLGAGRAIELSIGFMGNLLVTYGYSAAHSFVNWVWSTIRVQHRLDCQTMEYQVAHFSVDNLAFDLSLDLIEEK